MCVCARACLRVCYMLFLRLNVCFFFFFFQLYSKEYFHHKIYSMLDASDEPEVKILCTKIIQFVCIVLCL